MSNEERIKADAEAYANSSDALNPTPYEILVWKECYTHGAMAWAERSQVLVDALEEIGNSPVPLDGMQMLAWTDMVKNVCREALEQWKGKELKDENP